MTAPELDLRLDKLTSFSLVAADWRDLERRAEPSFFTSWRWVGAWLAALDAEGHVDDRCRMLRVELGGVLVGLAVVYRGLAGDAATLYLNQTGDTALDSIYVEYNGVLVDRVRADVVRPALIRALATHATFASPPWKWRSFMLAGADAPTFAAVRQAGVAHRLVKAAHCRWIDLAAAGRGEGGVLGLLSRNTRQQVRRAARLAERNGPLSATLVETAGERAAALEELRRLHEARWQAEQGHSGAFSNPFFARFIERLLMPSDIDAGAVDVMRIAAGSVTIGILVNFRYRREVYSYLAGFAYDADNRTKPGLLSHALAADHYVAAGMAGYHFMAGDAQYKSSLGPSREDLYWLLLRRSDPVSRIEDAAWRAARAARNTARRLFRLR